MRARLFVKIRNFTHTTNVKWCARKIVLTLPSWVGGGSNVSLETPMLKHINLCESRLARVTLSPDCYSISLNVGGGGGGGISDVNVNLLQGKR